MVLLAAAAFILTACSGLQEDGGEKNIRINLPPIVSASGNSRALSGDRLPTLKTETRKYRVTVNGITREGTGSSYEFTLAVGIRATAIIECLNSNGEVIIRAVKDFTVSSGENSIDINLKNDGTEIIPSAPQPVPNQVTYSYGEADRHGNKNGIPSDPKTYSEGDLFTVEDGSGMTWDHATQQSGFLGWKTNVALVGDTDSSTADVQANGNVQVGGKYKMPRGGVTLTAQWNKKSYSITYQTNEANSGGTQTQSVPSTSSVEALASANISSDTPPQVSTPTATYTFTGWNTQAGGGGTAYRAGQQITMMTEDITLYAQWTSANVYTVTYNIGSGPTAADSGWVANDTYTEGISSAITLPTLTATGYRFDGWQINGATQQGGATYTPTGNVDATAQWTPITYTITYNPDGGTVNPSSDTFDVTTGTINFPQANGKTGYSFDYWKTADGTRVTVYDSSQLAALVPSGSTTLALTAVWREETYNIEYTVASGEGTGNVSASFTITQNGGQVTLNDGTAGFTRGGYRIASWKYDDGSSAGNAGAQVAAATLIAKVASGSTSLQLTAVWTPIQYTITYNANGGGSNPASTAFNIESGTVTLDTGSSLSKSGYGFAGWSTQQNGTAITDTSASALIGLMSGSNTSVTLYAVWIQKHASLSTSGGPEQFYDSFADAWDAMNTACGSDPDVPYVVKMYEDAAVTSSLEPAGADVTLDLNGHTLDGSGLGSQMPVIAVSFNGAFTLADSSSQATGTIKGASYTAVFVGAGNSTPTFNMTGGKITGVNSSDGGGGVNVGVRGTFNMSGGTITGNTASDGGGVNVAFGTFNMSGGTISGNTATSEGGGVYVATGGTFNISGNVQITGNQKNGGADSNVYLPAGNNGDSKTITLTGTLNAASRIGVTLQIGNGAFTTGWAANKDSADAATVFTSDETGKTISDNVIGDEVFVVI